MITKHELTELENFIKENTVTLPFTNSAIPVLENSEEASKFDEGKPDYSLLSGDALDQVCYVLMHGAKVHGRSNWKQGLAWNRCLAAAMRHIMKFVGGKDNDKDTGYSHLAHAICELMFVLHYTQNKVKYDRFDDR